MFSTVDRGLTNLIHDRYSCTLFTLSSVSSSACLFHAWKVSNRGEFLCSRCQLGWMCPLKLNKPCANGRVSYDSLTHSRNYCRDREKSKSRINIIFNIVVVFFIRPAAARRAGLRHIGDVGHGLGPLVVICGPRAKQSYS